MPSPRLVRSIIATLSLLITLTATASYGQPVASDPPAARSVYDALRAARPDGRSVAVQGFEVKRNAFTFRFDGTFHFLAPVKGATFGAVFLGRGAFALEPASPVEKQHLARMTGNDAAVRYEDTFEEMVLFFLDGTDYDVTDAGEVRKGSPAATALAAYDRYLDFQRRQIHTNVHLRLLEDLVNDGAWQRGVFLAFFDGARTPPALAALDPRGCDALRITRNWSREPAFFLVDGDAGGFWYASDPRRTGPGASRAAAPDWADAEHYDIEARIDGDRLAGRTIVRLKSQVPRLEVLPVHLEASLRIARVAMRRPQDGETWIDGDFVQEDAKEDPDATVLLPAVLGEDETAELRIEYAGDSVLQPMGDNVFAVGARVSWYPNLVPFRDLADYRIRFDLPLGRQVVATGHEVESTVADQRHVQTFESETPLRVAGFNYGDFKGLVEKDAATTTEIAVYTTKGRPEILDLIEGALQGGARRSLDASGSGQEFATPQEEAAAIAGRSGFVGNIDSSQLARSALVDAMNAGRVAASYFGPFPYPRVAITQQSEWSFGQSWPGLIFMPYMTFLASLHRVQIGELLGGFVSDAQLEHVGYHEYAHQWWGHQVGWDSYRDQWLSEGFAEFSAGLVAEHTKKPDDVDKFWASARDRILEKPRGAKIPNYKAGPVSLGYRLAGKDNSSAPGAILYSKGAYILHMLRMMMWENQSQPPDRRFAEMMRDFATSFAGKAATNADFEAVVKRHMTPQMDLTGDGTMSWFFDQWLHGTEIPSFRNALAVERAGDQYRIVGTVQQLGVSDSFRSYVPMYLDFGKDGMARLGGVRVVGTTPQTVDVTVRLPAKPKRVVLNARHDVLALQSE